MTYWSAPFDVGSPFQLNANPGAEKVTTGDFASATGWTVGAGWSIAAGVATHSNGGGTAVLEQSVSAVANEIYKVVFTVAGIGTGSVTASVGGVSGTARSTNATFTEFIKATGTGNLQFTPTNDFDGNIDNVSVKRVAVIAADRVATWVDDQNATAGKGAVHIYTEDGTGYVIGPQMSPLVSNGAPLGSTTTPWSDLFGASGFVFNLDNGDVTLTHAANDLALAGGNLTINDSQTVRFGTGGAESTIGSDGTNTVFTRSNGVLRLTDGIYWLGTTGRALDSTFANANMTAGWVISQGAADNEILAFKSSDVAHGVTGMAETDNFGLFQKVGANDGGMQIKGLTEATIGLILQGIGVTDNTTKSTAGAAYLRLDAIKKSGTGAGAVGTDGNLVAFTDNGTTRFIFDVEGDSHEDGTGWTAYDDHNDIELLNMVNVVLLAAQNKGDAIKSEFWQWALENRAKLQALKLITFNSDGHHFINRSKMQELHTGALRQLGHQYEAIQTTIGTLQARLAQAEQRLAALPAA